MLEYLAYWLIAVNFAAFAAFGIDKARAESGAWRIRESTLLNLAFVGGMPGAYAGRAAFRHKTRKTSFSDSLHGIALLQLFAAAVGGAFYLFPAPLQQGLRDVSGIHTLFRSDEEIAAIHRSVTYRSCDEARALGAAPVKRGQPGYRDWMDGDGDGAGCEPYQG